MKKKNSYSGTEASFDTLMADQSGHEESCKANSESDSAQNSESNVKEVSQTKQESDRDSDYEGSDVDSKGEITTLRMLFEKCHSPDYEFYESCSDVGLLSPTNDKCVQCDCSCPYVESQSSIDNLLRRCPKCDIEWSVRRNSWVDGLDASLKELTLTIYCWCRGYTHSLTSHELEIDPNTVSLIFTKCLSVADAYYQNPLSNIGGKNKTVLTDMFTYNDRTVIGLYDQHSKNVYYQILNSNYDESGIITILVDNLAEGSTVLTNKNSRLSQLLDLECLSYLKDSWDIDFKVETISNESLILHWTEFESLLPPAHNLDPAYAHLNSDSILKQSLFRKRMESSKDCFLFFLSVVSDLFNSSYS